MKMQTFGLIVFACATSVFSASGQQTNPQPVAINYASLKRLNIKPIGDWQVDPAETAYLDSLFTTTIAAANNILPGPEATAQRREVDNELRSELETFVATNANSAYAPALHVWLGNTARMRCGYSRAIDHYQAAFGITVDSADASAQSIALESSAALAKLLALTGRLEELDALEEKTTKLANPHFLGPDWGSAFELRAWARKHPTDAYKCGLYCLDQLGRLTQPGQYLPKAITETPSSPNGFTIADLVHLGNSVGLKVHPALLTDPAGVPVPCILHLSSEHFVVVRERRGAFYNVQDPVGSGPTWLTAAEIMDEATGGIIVLTEIQMAKIRPA